MTTDLSNYTIGFPLYTGFDSLDVLGPFQVFTFLGVKPILLAAHSHPVKSLEGVQIQPHETFKHVYSLKNPEGNVKLDAFFVPGANTDGLKSVLELGPMGDNKYLDFLVEQAEVVQMRLAVCTGALLLGAAGLLEGYTATTHWAYHNILASFPGVNLASGYPRYVIDRNLVTGGGISSGIDEALAIAGILGGDTAAEGVQLSMQYAPNPPYHAGDPTQAGPSVLYSIGNGMGATDLAQAFDAFIG